MSRSVVPPVAGAIPTRLLRGVRVAAGADERGGPILLVLLGLAILAVLTVLFVTRNGIGLSTDSVVYIDGARNLARGDGFTSSFSGLTEPIAHWPPLYSVALAAIGLLGIDPLPGARVLSALLFGASVFVAGWLVRRHGSAGLLPVMATSVLVLVSADLLEVHAWAWSEPLFFLFAALGLHSLAVYLEHPRSRRWLIAAAALVCLATLTRYVGITLIMAGGVAILWLAPGRWLRRGVDAAIFGMVSMAPPALWVFRNFLLTGSGSGRELALKPIDLSHLMTAASTVSAWLVPPILPAAVRMLLLLAAAAAVAIGIIRERTLIREVLQAPGGRLLTTIVVFFVVYGGFLALSISLVDADDLTFDERLLSPVHLLLLVAVGLVLSGARRVRHWVWVGLGMVVLMQAAHQVSWMRAAEPGLGYTAPALRESRLWSVIEQLPDGTPLYSNAYDVIYIYTGRMTKPLPGKSNPNSLSAYDDYGGPLASLRAELAQNRGVAIYLPIGSWRRYMPSEAELDEALGPGNSRRYPDGVLYQVPREPPTRAIGP